MNEPVLAIDFGTTTSAAALVLGDRTHLVKEPATGAVSWPSAVYAEHDTLLVGSLAEQSKGVDPAAYRAEFKRDLGQDAPVPLAGRNHTAQDLAAAIIGELKNTAEQIAATPVKRAVLTIPASYLTADPRRRAMLDIGHAVGFDAVELLLEPVAAAQAPVSGTPPADGATLLVYDFGGGTFDAAVVRTGPHQQVLGHASLDDCGGHDLDALISTEITRTGGQALAARLDGLPDPLSTARARIDLGDTARQLKHQLSAGTSARRIFDRVIPITLTRDRLADLARPILDRTLTCCLDLLGQVDLEPKDLTAVVLVGGATRMPLITDAIATTLARPVIRSEDPDLAVVHGAAVWAAQAHRRTIDLRTPTTHETPLRVDLPDGHGQLLRWHTVPGHPHQPNDALAEIRRPDGSIWTLRAPQPATTTAAHARPGDTIHTGDWILTTTTAPATRTATATSPAPRPRPTRATTVTCTHTTTLTGHTNWVYGVAFSPDGRLLATASADHTARLWDVATGTGTRTLTSHTSVVYGVAFSPDGQLLATTSDDKTTRLWRIANGG